VPARALPAVGALSGTVAWAVLPGRRGLVRRHLGRVLAPDPAGGPHVRAAFRSYAGYWLDTFRVRGMDPDDLDRRGTVHGLDRVDRALDRGRGAILALPHMGSWEQAGAWLASRGYPVTVVMERLRPARLLEWFVDVRQRVGMEVLVRGPGVEQELERALSRNHLVGLVSDRDLGGRGVPVRFFGEETTLPAGPGRLAVRTGAPLLPAGVYTGPGRRWCALVRPPIDVHVEVAVAAEGERGGKVAGRGGGAPAAGERAAVAAVTEGLAAELELLIRRAPTQWHMMQPNWPSDRG
jgi:lauroyl/myristoyl acyltransferase